jgi:hypothetical protein
MLIFDTQSRRGINRTLLNYSNEKGPPEANGFAAAVAD